MTQLKTKTVYTLVDVKVRNPTIDNDLFPCMIMKKEDGVTTVKHSYGIWKHGQWSTDPGFQVIEWYEEQEEVFVFTKEELKTIIGDAFIDGMDNVHAHHNNDAEPILPEQYLLNLIK